MLIVEMLPPDMSSEQFAELLSRFDFDPSCAQSCGASQNFVYHVSRKGERYIARISTARHRSRCEIEAELDWVNYLKAAGLPVCTPLVSNTGVLCEQLANARRTYFLTAFTWAPGRKPVREDLCPNLCYRIGQLVGKMHSASTRAELLGKRWHRKQWQVGRLLKEDLCETQVSLSARFRRALDIAIQDLVSLPATAVTYGLIHADINFGNLHIDDEQLWLFDFDNCEYGHFAQDLVTILYDSIYSKVVKHVSASVLTSTVAHYWQHVVQGYRNTGGSATLTPFVVRRCFLLREAVLYVHYHRVLPREQWSDPYLAHMKRNVETDANVLDFSVLAA